jgi:transcriptional regulator with XRE-family HTH domain
MSRDGIARLELGDRWPRVDTVIKLAAALELPLSVLLGEESDPEPDVERLRRLAEGLSPGSVRLLIGIASLLRREASRGHA